MDKQSACLWLLSAVKETALAASAAFAHPAHLAGEPQQRTCTPLQPRWDLVNTAACRGIFAARCSSRLRCCCRRCRRQVLWAWCHCCSQFCIRWQSRVRATAAALSTSKCHYQAWNGVDTIGSPSSVMMEDMPCAACARNTLTMPSSSILQAKRYGAQGPFCGHVQA